LHHNSLILKSDRSEIHKVESLLNEINQKFNLNNEKFINLQIAATEAVINAIVHGNKENSTKNVYVDMYYDSEKLTVDIRDEGKGFDIGTIPDPTKNENLLKEGGRGLFIIKTLCDLFEFQSTGKGSILKITMLK
jgi:serine/threonine-protein kinase RsbW